MRYAKGRKEETRGRIIAAAARTFRSKGFVGAGVDDVMKAAGLTAGGFYAHFPSKDALFAAVLDHAVSNESSTFDQGFEGKTGEELLRSVVGCYLSAEHRDRVERGCPIPPLIAEVSRAGKRTRTTFERAFAKRLARLSEKLPAAKDMDARATAIALLSAMVGGLALSRAVASGRLSDEILAACRQFLLVSGREAPKSGDPT